MTDEAILSAPDPDDLEHDIIRMNTMSQFELRAVHRSNLFWMATSTILMVIGFFVFRLTDGLIGTLLGILLLILGFGNAVIRLWQVNGAVREFERRELARAALERAADEEAARAALDLDRETEDDQESAR